MIEFKTSGGYIAHIKESLDWDEYEEIQAVMMDGFEVDPVTQNPGKISAGVILKANRKAYELLVEKVVDPSGKVVVNKRKVPIKDGKEIAEKVKEIQDNSSLDEKKGS